MNSVTVQVDQLIEWVVSGYVFLHIVYGLVTHYHSVLQVRKYNKNSGLLAPSRVSPFKMFVFFGGRMTAGLPWFVLRSVIAPVGNQWHMTPEQISTWNGT